VPHWTTQFHLSIEDVDHIEGALRCQKKDLSLNRLAFTTSESDKEHTEDELNKIDAKLTRIHDLLGRLHNQKVFYRPPNQHNEPYIGG